MKYPPNYWTPDPSCEDEGHDWKYLGSRDGFNFYQCRVCGAGSED